MRRYWKNIGYVQIGGKLLRFRSVTNGIKEKLLFDDGKIMTLKPGTYIECVGIAK